MLKQINYELSPYLYSKGPCLEYGFDWPKIVYC